MKTIYAVILGWTIVLLADPALATCTTHTIRTPSGETIYCQTCCFGSGGCTTTCL